MGYTVSHVFVWRLNHLFTFFFIYDIYTEFGILTGSCLILIGEGINVSFNIHMQKNKNKNKQKAVNILNVYKT